jgi:NAD(P)H-binding
VRNPEVLAVRPEVHIEKGTPASKEDIERCFSQKTPDVVFVNLAPVKSTTGGPFLTNCVKNIVEVMEGYGTRKIVYMSAYGVDDSFQNLNWLMRFLVPSTKLAKEFEEHKGAEQILKQLGNSSIQWTVVRPVMLKNGPARETKTLGDQGQDVQNFLPGITRASVAQFMIEAAKDSNWNGKTPVICN